MKTLHIDASLSYDILIGSDLLKHSGDLCARALNTGSELCKLLIISDDNVKPLYEQLVSDSLTDRGFEVSTFTFKAGESQKNMDTVSEILNRLAELHFTRKDAIVALGGGVTGDLAGFVAAIYLRGIPFIQIPTTFLSAVDSSVGGKTGANLPAGKNLAGAFWQPSLVICDTDTFRTLSYDIFLDGVAEALKYGIIADAPLFHRLCHLGASLFDLKEKHSSAALADIIANCLKIKANIVQADEFDRGERQILNFGHTFGHAIEKLSDYKISHGHAVASGMLIIATAAYKRGICDISVPEAIRSALDIFRFPYKHSFSPEALAGVASLDKKRSGAYINLVLPHEIGRCSISKVPTHEIAEYAERI